MNNFVLKDGVMKEQIGTERRTSERWGKRWSFLLDSDQRCLQIAREPSISEQQEYSVGGRGTMTTRRKGPKLPAVSTRDPESSGPMPLTTTGEVGWRSSKACCNLETLGPLYVSPRTTMDPPFGEPTSDFKYIMLG
ncbi:PREDICTED: uncharacterized protein C20orf85 homolog [Nicrophorus vespilloides]|uniref:Uncharacterized protein C20orf85 homolog n=1 Tax=Nicrophorus vespilloides TaxID=110193 RepID=A0ABM1M6A1_NICVS|nr:PREDICTED: uncharacterized protein C20orf85 homolog [Nicrophorus vespilloides]